MRKNGFLYLVIFMTFLVCLIYPLVLSAQEEYVFVRSFPSDGTGLWCPKGLAVDSEGNVYVAEYRNYRIQKFTSDGVFLTKWGDKGTKGMGFSWRFYGIAISPSRLVYAADTGNHCIKVFRSLSKQAITWGKIKQTELYQNYPNPLNPETWIPYRLAESADVSISIYSESGKLVRKLVLGHKEAGSYLDRSRAGYWDGKDGSGELVSSGVYFYELEAGSYYEIKKMIVMR